MTRDERFMLWLREVNLQAEKWGDEFDPDRKREDGRSRAADGIARRSMHACFYVDPELAKELFPHTIDTFYP